MLKKEHLKQVSVEKVIKIANELGTQVLSAIDEQTGYLNDIEKVTSAVLISNMILDACKDTTGENSVDLIMKHIASTKEKSNYERNEGNQKKW